MCELHPSRASPTVLDLGRMAIGGDGGFECDFVCLCSFWTEFVTGCLWVGCADPREAVGWSQGPDHD